ncbi:hypothetical protein C8F04DRAFT_1179294 [Mycena alexandri]|uniref:Uncharacterized protein n=1 Tax=Mycena alexandri TaxID=1745969 RepID=A0AAD6T3D2_9AGAR|nr:hypothetical protein C8F04DRAFT_1179294 [Mycena alexandri]
MDSARQGWAWTVGVRSKKRGARERKKLRKRRVALTLTIAGYYPASFDVSGTRSGALGVGVGSKKRVKLGGAAAAAEFDYASCEEGASAPSLHTSMQAPEGCFSLRDFYVLFRFCVVMEVKWEARAGVDLGCAPRASSATVAVRA